MNSTATFQPVQASIALDRFAATLAEMLADIGHSDLLAPGREAYRLRPASGGAWAIEVELQLGPGATVRVAAPFADDGDPVRDDMAELQARLVATLSALDTLLALRDRIDREAHERMRRAARSGVVGRVIGVRLGDIDLATSFGLGAVTVTIEGEACDMLRTLREEWHVDSFDDLTRRFADFSEQQHRRAPLRRAARAQGAVGFVDPLALAVADTLPGGRQAALRTIARVLEHNWYLDRGDGGRPERMGLVWHDGIVHACARLGDRVTVAGEDLYLDGIEIDQTAVGAPITKFVDHPALADRRIADVRILRPGFANVRLDRRGLAFSADGTMLPG